MMIPVVRTWLWFIHTHQVCPCDSLPPNPQVVMFLVLVLLALLWHKVALYRLTLHLEACPTLSLPRHPTAPAVSLHYLGLAVTFGKRSNNLIGLCDHPRKPAAPVICPEPPLLPCSEEVLARYQLHREEKRQRCHPPGCRGQKCLEPGLHGSPTQVSPRRWGERQSLGHLLCCHPTGIHPLGLRGWRPS